MFWSMILVDHWDMFLDKKKTFICITHFYSYLLFSKIGPKIVGPFFWGPHFELLFFTSEKSYYFIFLIGK